MESMNKFYEVEISGTKHPIYYGMAALDEFLTIQNITLRQLSTLTDNMSFSMIINLVMVGLKHGYRRAGKDFTISYEDVADMMDENPDLFKTCMDLFSEAMPKPENNGQEKGNSKALRTKTQRSQ